MYCVGVVELSLLCLIRASLLSVAVVDLNLAVVIVMCPHGLRYSSCVTSCLIPSIHPYIHPYAFLRRLLCTFFSFFQIRFSIRVVFADLEDTYHIKAIPV